MSVAHDLDDGEMLVAAILKIAMGMDDGVSGPAWRNYSESLDQQNVIVSRGLLTNLRVALHKALGPGQAERRRAARKDLLIINLPVYLPFLTLT